jgi:hypothetical protein
MQRTPLRNACSRDGPRARYRRQFGQDNCGVLYVPRVEEERRMSSTIEESVTPRDSLLEVEYDVTRREAERAELARDVEAQHERLHTLRATVLEELTKQRRVTLPRWPSGPKVVASFVDEDEWWNKMLGRKKAA